MEQEKIARVCHEVNRAYCQALGDDSQLPWVEAADWQRESAIKGVAYALENPDAPVSAQHDAWLADKKADGWKHGPVKNADTKEHPCFVSYDELPVEQKAKDYIFRAVVHALK
jgi:hypothetical protein